MNLGEALTSLPACNSGAPQSDNYSDYSTRGVPPDVAKFLHDRSKESEAQPVKLPRQDPIEVAANVAELERALVTAIARNSDLTAMVRRTSVAETQLHDAETRLATTEKELAVASASLSVLSALKRDIEGRINAVDEQRAALRNRCDAVAQFAAEADEYELRIEDLSNRLRRTDDAIDSERLRSIRYVAERDAAANELVATRAASEDTCLALESARGAATVATTAVESLRRELAVALARISALTSDAAAADEEHREVARLIDENAALRGAIGAKAVADAADVADCIHRDVMLEHLRRSDAENNALEAAVGAAMGAAAWEALGAAQARHAVAAAEEARVHDVAMLRGALVGERCAAETRTRDERRAEAENARYRSGSGGVTSSGALALPLAYDAAIGSPLAVAIAHPPSTAVVRGRSRSRGGVRDHPEENEGRGLGSRRGYVDDARDCGKTFDDVRRLGGRGGYLDETLAGGHMRSLDSAARGAPADDLPREARGDDTSVHARYGGTYTDTSGAGRGSMPRGASMSRVQGGGVGVGGNGGGVGVGAPALGHSNGHGRVGHGGGGLATVPPTPAPAVQRGPLPSSWSAAKGSLTTLTSSSAAAAAAASLPLNLSSFAHVGPHGAHISASGPPSRHSARAAELAASVGILPGTFVPRSKLAAAVPPRGSATAVALGGDASTLGSTTGTRGYGNTTLSMLNFPVGGGASSGPLGGSMGGGSVRSSAGDALRARAEAVGMRRMGGGGAARGHL